jgi:DMSO/TMAO reductase YedYZ molybdopterin-dependent catalytic subunit
MFTRSRPTLAVLLAVAFLQIFAASPRILAQAPAVTGPSEIRVEGAVATPLTLTAGDLKKMPRKTLTVTDPHDKKQATYEGVLLEELLERAGVPHGEKLRGPLMASYVLVLAADDYRVVFARAELDPGVQESDVIVADTMDGAPIPSGQGPFRLIAPHDKRPARWVRMVKSITVVNAPK